MKFPVGLPLTPTAGCVAIVALDTCPFIESYLQFNANSEPRRALMWRQLQDAANGTSQLIWFYESLRQAARGRWWSLATTPYWAAAATP